MLCWITLHLVRKRRMACVDMHNWVFYLLLHIYIFWNIKVKYVHVYLHTCREGLKGPSLQVCVFVYTYLQRGSQRTLSTSTYSCIYILVERVSKDPLYKYVYNICLYILEDRVSKDLLYKYVYLHVHTRRDGLSIFVYTYL